jgi:hypothetical protein
LHQESSLDELAAQMFQPLLKVLEATLTEQIDEDLEELERLMMKAEYWCLTLLDDGKPAAGLQKEEGPTGGSGFAGGMGSVGLGGGVALFSLVSAEDGW